MFQKIKRYFADRKQHKWVIGGLSKITEGTVEKAHKLIDSKKLNMSGIKNYICHLPIVGFDVGYPRDIYVQTTQCLLRMWQYSKDMGFIDKSRTFKDFMGKDIGFDGDGTYRRVYKLSNGKEGYWEEACKELLQLADSLMKDV